MKTTTTASKNSGTSKKAAAAPKANGKAAEKPAPTKTVSKSSSTEEKLASNAKTQVVQDKGKPAETKTKPEPEVKTLFARITGFVPVTCSSDKPMSERIDEVLDAIRKDPAQFLLIKPGYTNAALVRQLHECYSRGLGIPKNETIRGMTPYKVDGEDGKTAKASKK